MNQSFEEKLSPLRDLISGENACKWSLGDGICTIVQGQLDEAIKICVEKNKSIKHNQVKSIIRKTMKAIASEIGFSTRMVNLHRTVSMIFEDEKRYENTKWEMYAASLKMPDPVATLNLAHDQCWSVRELKVYIKQQNPKPTVSEEEQFAIEAEATIERFNSLIDSAKIDSKVILNLCKSLFQEMQKANEKLQQKYWNEEIKLLQ